MPSQFRPDDLLLILEGISDGVVKIDLVARYLGMNNAAREIFRRLGLDPDWMIGRSVWEVFPNLKGTTIEREISRSLTEHLPMKEEFYFPLDQRWYETQGYPSKGGMILIFRDISAQRAKPS